MARVIPSPDPASPNPRSAERFVLRGRSVLLDPRIHAFRPDLADAALADCLFAPHYAGAEISGVVTLTTPIRATPQSAATAVTELARGELFAVLDRAAGWAWGYCAHDHYVGYVAIDALGPIETMTHVVAAPAALLFAASDIKAPVVARWPLGTRFAARGETGAFLETDGGFIHTRHARASDDVVADAVGVAEALIGVPYRWGGRGGDGIDCSGLVQRAMALAGIAVPRDSDQQQAIGSELAADAPLARGDLVFFPGHVGLMADATTLVHANAHWMRVTAEPLAVVTARLGGADSIVGRRRIG